MDCTEPRDLKYEKVYNSLLPYHSMLDKEADALLSDIKANLSKAAQCRDFAVGFTHWNNVLNYYVTLYGPRFSQADHIQLVLLYYDIVTTKDLGLSLVQHYSSMLSQLLRKSHLLPREEVTLAWKPLYKLLVKVLSGQEQDRQLCIFPQDLEEDLKKLTYYCSPYFSLSSTAEIMDELRPNLYPFDDIMGNTLQYLHLLLPVGVAPENMDKGFRIWFEELMNLFLTYSDGEFEKQFVILFSGLAEENIGYIDWEPYIAQIFNRILRYFNLPMGASNWKRVENKTRSDLESWAIWAVSMLGPGSSAQKHLDVFFKASESFYHPSNEGAWTTKLERFLEYLTDYLRQRVKHERNPEEGWRNQPPADRKLRDDDIDAFIATVLPITLTSMFSKQGASCAANSLRAMAALRPAKVIPPILDRLYPALETLTEPHRLTACFTCLPGLARPLLDSPVDLPDGPAHLVPLLMLCLPGIDVNDQDKSRAVFGLVYFFSQLVPFVDCSEAMRYRQLNESQIQLYESSTEFEDFVVQFIDRVLQLIESSAEQRDAASVTISNTTIVDNEEMESWMKSATQILLQQVSAPIFKHVLRKVYRFATTSLLDNEGVGQLVYGLCKANCQDSCKVFMNSFCDHIDEAMTNIESNMETEKLPSELRWYMNLLIEVVKAAGPVITDYKDMLIRCLDATLVIDNKDGYSLSCNLLEQVLRSLTEIDMLESRSSNEDFTKLPLSQYDPLSELGKPYTPDQLKLHWHIPGANERDVTMVLLRRYLIPELTYLMNITDSKVTYKKQDVLRRLHIVHACLWGVAGVVAPLQGEEEQLVESSVPLKSYAAHCGQDENLYLLDGRNVRNIIVDSLRPLLDYVMNHQEDDTASLIKISNILHSIITDSGRSESSQMAALDSYDMLKADLSNKLRGKKRMPRRLLCRRVIMQHKWRMVQRLGWQFTGEHVKIYKDMVRLSISRYSEVRKTAQSTLSEINTVQPHSYHVMVDDVIHNLRKHPDVPEHALKGALYLVAGEGADSLMVRHDWKLLRRIWIAVLRTYFATKTSVSDTIGLLITRVIDNFESPPIYFDTPDHVIKRATQLLGFHNYPPPSQTGASEYEIDSWKQREQKRVEEDEQEYLALCADLVGLIDGPELHSQYRLLAMCGIMLMMRRKPHLPSSVVNCVFRSLLSDDPSMRQFSLQVAWAVMEQIRAKAKKQVVDPYQVSSCERPAPGSKYNPGFRKDNEWVQYRTEKLSADNSHLVETVHTGYYCWPKELKLNLSAEKQEITMRTEADLTPVEAGIYAQLTSPDYLPSLLLLWAEDEDPQEGLELKKYKFFKLLFRRFGVSLATMVKPILDRLLAEKQPEMLLTSQRTACEVIGGLLRGMKHWPHAQVESVKSWLVPMIRTIIDSQTPDTHPKWCSGIGIAFINRDPRRFSWLYEMLLDEPLRADDRTAANATRLGLLNVCLKLQSWRVNSLRLQILPMLRAAMSNHFKKIRDVVAKSLCHGTLVEQKVVGLTDNESQADPSSLSLQCLIEDTLERAAPILRAAPLQDHSCPTSRQDSPRRDSPIRPSKRRQLDLPPRTIEIEMTNGNADEGDDGLEALARLGITPAAFRAHLPPSITSMMQAGNSDVDMKSIVHELQCFVAGQVASQVAGQVSPGAENRSTLDGRTRPVLRTRRSRDAVGGRESLTSHKRLSRETSVELAISESVADESDEDVDQVTGNDEVSTALRVCRTAMTLVRECSVHLHLSAVDQLIKLLPLICAARSLSQEDEVRNEYMNTLPYLGFCSVSPNSARHVIAVIDEVCSSPLWHSRVDALQLLMIIVSKNIFSFQDTELRQAIARIVKSRLCDDKLEVRQRASEALSGLIHIGFVQPDVCMTEFLALAKTPLRKRKRGSNMSYTTVNSNGSEAAALTARHAGVLGLAALVQAAPYDVPKHLPAVIMRLSEHAQDMHPIQQTVRDTLSSFKRTHADSWQQHKELFSDDELAVLTDLLVSPNYYA